MKQFFPLLVVLIALTAAVGPSASEQPEIVLDDDERLVESAGLPSDGPALLEYFRGRARTEAEPDRIDDLVRRLSGPSIEERIHAGSEFITLGPLAIPSLRRVRNDLESPEVREQAKRCLNWVEGPGSVNLTMAAARVIAKRKPAGSAEALLAYVPFADNEEVTREVSAALRAVAVIDGRADPVLVRALSDPMPLRRALAASILSQSGTTDQKQAVEKLLQDPNPEVRLQSALAQAKARNAAAFPVLIDLLVVLPTNKRTQVEEVLQEWAGEWAPAGGPAGEDEIARRIRRDSWAAWWSNTEGPALMTMLDKRTLAPAEHKKVLDAIRRLGENDYKTREKATAELLARGRIVLPSLREALKNNNPLELIRCAEGCIERIEAEPAHRMPSAAFRILALRRPPGAAEALLAHLPFAEEDNLSEAQAALGHLALRNGKLEPALLAALSNASAVIRGSAAEALAQGGGAEARGAMRKLLGDVNLTVRMRVAQALAPRDAEAIPVLIDLIALLPADQAVHVHDFLTPLGGEKAPMAPGDSVESRKSSSAEWTTWWKANSAKAELTRLTEPEHQKLGYTCICEWNTGRIFELGRDRKIRWSFNGTQNPTDALVLPNNRVVIAEFTGSKVTERDFKGNIIWSARVVGNPHNVQRLPNGNTVIASNNQIVEVDRTGKAVFTLNVNQIPNVGNIGGAYKTRKGQFVCISQGGLCAHIDKTGKVLKSFNTGIGGAYMDMLPNGRILISQNGGSRVSEYDPEGKLLLQLSPQSINGVSGLPSGNVLVASNTSGRVMELDRKGKVLWEFMAQGPFRARGR